MMTQPTRTSVKRTAWKLPLAVLLFFAMIAAACGNQVIESATESAPSTAITPEALPDVEYGASIDEWTDAVRESGAEDDTQAARPSGNPDMPILEWDDLIPAGYSTAEVWARYEDQFAELEFGTEEETALYAQVQSEIDHEIVEPDLDGQQIRMTGFVAPLTYDEEIVTEFLLVPYFGACIHVPAPPSNQTVMVTVDKANGFTVDEAWGAVWVEGTINVEAADNELGASSYMITGGASGVYEDF